MGCECGAQRRDRGGRRRSRQKKLLFVIPCPRVRIKSIHRSERFLAIPNSNTHTSFVSIARFVCFVRAGQAQSPYSGQCLPDSHDCHLVVSGAGVGWSGRASDRTRSVKRRSETVPRARMPKDSNCASTSGFHSGVSGTLCGRFADRLEASGNVC